MPTTVRILLVSGSLRTGSGNSAALRTAAANAPAGCALPSTRPTRCCSARPSTPALPGSFENLLDWTVGGTGLYGAPVAWVNISGLHAPTRGADAHASLCTVLGYLGAPIVEPAVTEIPVPRQAIGVTA